MADIKNVGTFGMTPIQEAELRLGGKRRCTTVTYMVIDDSEEVCHGEVRVMGIGKRDERTRNAILKQTGEPLHIKLLCTRCGYVDFEDTEVVP